MKHSILFCVIAGIIFVSLKLLNSVTDEKDHTEGSCIDGSIDGSIDGCEEVTERSTEQARQSIVLGRNDTLYEILYEKGVRPADIVSLTDELKPFFDPRRMKKGDSLYYSLDSGGGLQVLEYVNDSKRYVVSRDDGNFSCRAEDIAFDITMRTMGGVIWNSLYEDVIAAGGNGEVAVALATIFEGKVDFFTDLRRGDIFKIVLEALSRDGSFREFGRIHAAALCVNGRWEKAYYYRQKDEIVGEYFDEKGRSLRGIFLRSPLNYRRISSSFSYRRFHPILKRYQPHLGIDYAAPVGTPVVSVGDGVVTFSGWKGPNGKLVVIKHANNYTTSYGHLSRYAKGIRKGVRIRQGQVIGYVGSTGRSTGPHLDFRMKKDGLFVNPLKLKPVSTEKVSPNDQEEFDNIVTYYDAYLQYTDAESSEISR
jgi:murein DD-endopeptidase MepM/ murein hydrolase activator NlpD